MPETWRPTRQQREAAREKTIPDVLAPGLRLLFVGINPGLYSAAVGHHFAGPGNRFWPALYDSGLTDRLLSPFEDQQLVRYGCGITNVVDRATGRADELAAEEFVKGAERVTRKVERFAPQCVAFLGLTAYRTAFGKKQAAVGRQEETLGGVDLWVLPNPSGLNAHYQRADFASLFGELRQSAFAGTRP